MKFIAASDFKNVPRLGISPVSGAPNKDHIPKGTRFAIGTSDNIADLRPEQQETIGHLWHAGRIVSEDNTKAAKLIDDEVKMEKARLEKLDEKEKTSGATVTAEGLIALFEKMQATKVGEKK